MNPHSVYAVCGGFDKLVPFLEGVCGRMLRDDVLGPFFRGHNDMSKAHLQQQFIMYVVNATGGPTAYLGNDLRTAHQGLVLGPAEWGRFLEIVQEALVKYKFTTPQSQAFLSLLESTRDHLLECRE